MVPSVVAWATSRGARPPMPAPCARVAALRTPILRRKRAAAPEAERTTCPSNLSCLPRPTMTTRFAGSLPRVWMRVTSPSFPLNSPSAMRLDIAPSSAWSTVPVPPAGEVTPSNRETTTASASVFVMSPTAARTITMRLVSFSKLAGVSHTRRGWASHVPWPVRSWVEGRSAAGRPLILRLAQHERTLCRTHSNRSS